MLMVLIVIGIFGFLGLALAQEPDRFGLESATGVGLPQTDLRIAIINIIRFILGFLGIIAVIIILWGGYLWMTSGGDPSKIEKAKKTLVSAVIGLVIILSAFIIASFVINSLQGVLCQGDNCATESCPTPPCTPTCPNPPCTPGSSNQFTYINKFKDDSIPWVRTIGPSFSGVAKMPASATLEVGGYAKNKDGTIVSMELFTAPSTTPPIVFVAQSPFTDVQSDQEVVDNVFASWNSLAYAINNQYRAKISALLSGNRTIESRVIKTIVKPLHCFNNIQDQGETGIDCGGDPVVLGDDYCGACDGGPCVDDSDCDGGACLPDGTCAFPPFISSIVPDNGAKNNYITIWGSHFGDSPGSVMLIKDDVIMAFANVNTNPDCINGWNDTQIIFEVPDIALDSYEVMVESNIGLTSNTKEFEVNEISRPGICSVNPNYGINPDPLEIVGNSFPTAPDGQVYWNFKPDIFSSPSVTWINGTHASDIVPESGVGTTSIRIYNGVEYSNYYKFIISRGEIGDPCGTPGETVCSAENVCNTGLFCDPNQGCTCQVVVNACEPGAERDCEIDGETCVTKEFCPASGNWDDAVCTKVDPACVSGVTVEPATQSIFAWAFVYGNGYGFKPPQVIEDCSRVRECYPNQKLPSPAPWYEGVGATEGWDPVIHPNLSIEDPKACINSTISARFTQKMNEQSVKDYVKVFRCTSRDGTDCTPVNGEVQVYPTEEGVRDYFQFGSPTINNPTDFIANSWYKIVLTKGIKSIFNVEMDTSTQVVSNRFCNVAGITDAVYCWNFQTRETNTYCDPGCPECNPDPKTLNYYFQTQQFTTAVISDDNVCLMIDPWAYNWNWFSENEDKVMITNNGGIPQQIGTAYGENYNIFPGFTKVYAELTLTEQNDYCRVTTDFTNPVVMESPFCTRGIIQSPTPWINSKDACRNALVAARFSRDMHDESLTLNTITGLIENDANAKNGNIIVEECDHSENFEDAFPACESIKIAEATSLRIFTYSHDVDIQGLLAGDTSFGAGLAEGFVIDVNKKDIGGKPTADEYLASDMWYRVIILGGPEGVGGADNTGDGIPDGVLLTKNSITEQVRDGWDYNGDGFNDYYWVFKTSTHACDVSDVQVTPVENFLEFTDQTSQYDAFPQASNCNLLARCLLNWTWRSLIELGDTAVSESGEVIASITKLEVQVGICGAFDDNTIDPVQTATAHLDGDTNIRADEPGGKWGYGHLQVGYGQLAVIKYSPKNLTHFEDRRVDVDFNIDAKMSSIKFNDNTRLYKCTDAKAYYKFNNSIVDSSGNKYDSTNKSISYTTGYFGSAANFRGNANQYIQIKDDNNNLKIANALTISAWVRPTAPTSPLGRVVVSNYYWDLNPANQRGILLGDQWGCSGDSCVPTDEFQFMVYDATGNNAVASKPDFFKDNLNKWTHVVGVYELGVAVRLYINGVLAAQDITAVPAAIAYNLNLPTRIGARADNSGQGMWNGQIDDLRLYNKILTLNDIKALYTSSSECPAIGLVSKTLDPILPPVPIEAGPELSRKITARSSADYQVGAEYRMILKGGPNGLIAWNNNELSRLNFNSTGETGGEECEANIYPWTEQAGICTNTCLLSPSFDLCSVSGGRFAQCQNTVPDSNSDYCNNNCYNLGNNNTASCGNSVVETTKEECDDGNANNNDGCSNVCLWEGSDDSWGSICGNGRTENGENCDDGNTNNGDGCSSICLKEAARPSGSSANIPVCGNGTKERGEDCDDSNTTAGDGCSNTCLLEGSATTCGNGQVENGQADSFSWTFSAVNDPSVTISMNNCSNGIWQVLVKRGDIGADNIFICKRDALSMLDDNIWGKIIYKIKLVIAKFFGNSASAVAGDGCGVGYTKVTDFEETLEYLKQDSHVYTYVKDGYWDVDKKYKINVYEGTFDPVTNNIPKVAQEVTIKEYCKIDDVKVEIWPRGEESYNDNFFCVGDECGLHTSSLYDNDISSDSNLDAPVEDYDFPYVKINGTNVTDHNLANNQHLYLAWAINSVGYLIKSEGGLNWSVAGLPKFDLSVTDFDPNSNYSGEWLNLNSARVGAIDGQDVLTVGATQNPPPGLGLASTKAKDVNIKIFLCSNPWPDPQNFPYRDSANNCGATPCPNTNFEVYYCRDNGVVGEAEDLPSLDTSTIVYGGDPFKKEFLLQRADKSDAVGIRVVANDNHYSPLVWYRENFDPNRQGNPKSTSVNGYDAIAEGRTVYANAINIEPPVANRTLYPNIYLISYSEGADNDTQNIFQQMARFMKLNVGSNEEGGLPGISTCQNTPAYKCWDGSDCEAVNAGACMSDKGQLTRDTRRLGDIQDINWLLNDYQNQKRCSNDKFITCYSNAQCYGGGTCDYYYPDLPSGTYISGRSFSVWPSWQATLGNVLDSALPLDPLNASSGFDGCDSPYDPVTCWDEITKKMQCPTAAKVYSYFANNNGAIKNIYAFKEFNLGSWRPADWATVRFMNGDPFALAVESICRTFSGTCGNGTIEAGEDCNNCPFDVVCPSGNSCRQTGASWACTPDASFIDSDGDTIANKNDNCPFIANTDQLDTDGDKVGDACDNCLNIKNGSTSSTVTCLDKDSNGKLSQVEKAVCNQSDKDSDTVGDACDNCPNDYNKDQSVRPCLLPGCGDGVVQPGEDCDDGENPPTNAGTCNATCSAPTFCGDGFIQSLNGQGVSEVCDDNNGFSGDGCSNKCVIETGWVCVGVPTSVCHLPFCGDGLKKDTEVCDCGDGVGPLSAPSKCGNTGIAYNYTTYNIPPTANLNTYFIPYWNLTPVSWHFCNNACKDRTALPPYCSDGEWDNINEQCEGQSPTVPPTPIPSDGSFGWGRGLSATDQWACSNTCTDTGGYCGDDIKNGPEICEPAEEPYGELCANNCTWKACPPYTSNNITLSAFTGVPPSVEADMSDVPTCLSADKIKADFSITTSDPRAVIVFVNDLSGSMDGGPLNTLKSSLTAKIGDIFTAIPSAKIGLVSFSQTGRNDVGNQCPNSLCGRNNIDVLTDIISNYTASGGTNPADGLAKAQVIIDPAAALNKFVILMGDGAANTDKFCNINDVWPSCTSTNLGWKLACFGNQYQQDCSGDPIATTLKLDSKLKIYSVAYGAEADKEALNRISSNNGVGSCGTGFCLMGNEGDLDNLYISIIDEIQNNLAIDFEIKIGSQTTNFHLKMPISGPGVFNNRNLDLPPGFCTPTTNNRKVKVLGYGFTLSMTNLRLSYCPYHPATAYETGVASGNVAGDFEETKPASKLFDIIAIIKNLFFNLLSQIF